MSRLCRAIRAPTPPKTFTGEGYRARLLTLVRPPNGGSTPILVAHGRKGTADSILVPPPKMLTKISFATAEIRISHIKTTIVEQIGRWPLAATDRYYCLSTNYANVEPPFGGSIEVTNLAHENTFHESF